MKALVSIVVLLVASLVSAVGGAAQSTQYVTQMLEPTGGKIQRPADWFYSEHHAGSTYNWTITAEDSRNGGPYTTGVRIQAFAGVKAATGKSAREFVLDFVTAKKQSVDKIVSSCEESVQGIFTRICLETIEGPYRIMYSMFWDTANQNLAVVSISGTTRALWDTYAPVFQEMSAFELIDMKRFDAPPSPPGAQGDPLDAVAVYLVPLDDFPENLASSMAKRLQEDFKLRIKASLRLPPLSLTTLPGTNQYATEDILSLGKAASAALPEAAPATYRIFLTTRDINSRSANFRFQFSGHNTGLNSSVISLARLVDYANGQATLTERASTRVLKMTKRAIGEMKFGWSRSTDRADLMYSPLMSLDDLDRLGLEHNAGPGGGKALAVAPYRMLGVTMLQPEVVLSQRVSDPSGLADYFSRLGNAVSEAVKTYSPTAPAGGYLVVGVRPGGKAKAWLSLEPPLPAPLAGKVMAAAQMVPPPAVKNGTFVFGMKVSFWGGAAEGIQPYPNQWRAIAQKHSQPIEAGNLADLAWGTGDDAKRVR